MTQANTIETPTIDGHDQPTRLPWLPPNGGPRYRAQFGELDEAS